MLVTIYIFFGVGGGMLNTVGMKIGHEEKKNPTVTF